MTEPSEVVSDLRTLSRLMRQIADAMWRLEMGAQVDAHAKDLHGAAEIATGWADGIERETREGGGRG